jgi:hypothetical protein
VKKQELAQRLAEDQQVTTGAAADHLDDLIFSAIKKLKLGKSAAFPGLGRIRPIGVPRIKPTESQTAPQRMAHREPK